ncbi:hypothetical protein [Haladaptatus sp. DYF46]|uniref:hypothetical protein n=1 Tax=Haladaptatus sp. DYF46 TaxID=2886041 RepID=UPI001E41CD40|nr:hypothetical protein [Haladaptatus sp. DYF46]
MSRKYVPCLVCDPEMRYDPEIEFLHPSHHEAKHDPSLPRDHDSYLAWVAERYELDPEHPVFEPGGLTRPEDFHRFKHLFE